MKFWKAGYAMLFASALYAGQLQLKLDWSLGPESRSYFPALGPYPALGMAFNPASSHLLVVDRLDTIFFGGAVALRILDANDGSELGQLDSSTIEEGAYRFAALHLIAAADDGAIYGANVFPVDVSDARLKIYRWADEMSSPELVYSANPDPAVRRSWGHSLAVRGTGPQTELMMISSDGKAAAMFSFDLEGNLGSQILAFAEPLRSLSSNSEGHGLTFDNPDSFWASPSHSAALVQHRIDHAQAVVHGENRSLSIATEGIHYTSLSNYGELLALHYEPQRQLLGAVAYPFKVQLFAALGESSEALLIDTQDLPYKPKPSREATIQFGGPDRIFVLSPVNGLAAYRIVETDDSAPVILGQPRTGLSIVGQAVTMDVLASGSLPRTYQWFHNGNLIPGAIHQTLPLPNIRTNHAGIYTVQIANSLGKVASDPLHLVVVGADNLRVGLSRLGGFINMHLPPLPGLIVEHSEKLGPEAAWSKVPAEQNILQIDPDSESGFFRIRQ